MPQTREERLASMRLTAKAWRLANPERFKQNQRLWMLKNGDKWRAASKARAKLYRPQNKARIQAWRIKYPWYDSWQAARQRCENPKHPRYKRYGGRGIGFMLSKADMAFLWIRDNAATQYVPSLDRLDNDGPYSLDNCRIIEQADNSRKRALDHWKAKLGYNPSAFRH